MLHAPSMMKTPQSAGNISISMPITVQGNLDKSVIPDLERITDNVISRINQSIVKRGHIRTANQTII